MTSQSNIIAPLAEIGDERVPARPTSYDVAKLAGVSQSAVSRAFRDGTSVSAKTRKKIEAAADALGYAPSQIARSLISQRSRMIAVVATDLSSRAYPEILFYLGREIQNTGNRMLVFTVPSDEESSALLRDILAYHVDGIVSSAVLDDHFLSACQRQDVPVVLFNRAPGGAIGSAVACDHASAMDMLVSQVAPANPGPVAFVAGPQAAPVSRDRLAGARQSLAVLGREIEHLVHSDFSFDGGREAARSLMAQPVRPSFILCANDMMALGALDELRYGFGLSVPDDIAVTGFDDVPQAAWPSYELTTLRQPIRRMASTAVKLLIEQIDGTTATGERRLLPAELQIRTSARRLG